MMECFVGIDLGSTTTKAIFLDTNDQILGRGITNSRSNYALACQIAREEAETDARLKLLERDLKKPSLSQKAHGQMEWLLAKFALGHHLKQLEALEHESLWLVDTWPKIEDKTAYREAVETIFASMRQAAEQEFEPSFQQASHFFRDIASSLFLRSAEKVANTSGLSFERIASLFDKTILKIENQSFANLYSEYLEFACKEVLKRKEFAQDEPVIRQAVSQNIGLKFRILSSVGTGYGRLTLPFPKEQIRSEILCHGLGAHYMFPQTRTILDIGGQDTKAIQVDAQGIVTSFQMNDRCAAGCG
ncbi:MAG: benzoyl-CoA reductase subunit A, partial [Deltaproteobacteria bacterium]|nr:benzoyl-CoA reductase subunit A [Deltaproteobacteria bacterium]